MAWYWQRLVVMPARFHSLARSPALLRTRWAYKGTVDDWSNERAAGTTRYHQGGGFPGIVW